MSVNRLKPVFSDQLVISQQPSRRGRPLSSLALLTTASLTPAPFYSGFPESQGDEEAGSILFST